MCAELFCCILTEIPEELGSASRRGSHVTPALFHGMSHPLHELHTAAASLLSVSGL